MVIGDFGFRAGVDPKSRLFDPAMGGGGLMDVGVYVVSLANMFLGESTKVASLAEMCETGVDGQACAVIKYRGGELAMLATGVRTTTPAEARILGTDGYIEMHQPWWRNGKITVHNDKGSKSFEPKIVGNGYNYQAVEVGKCLAAGKLESDVMPWADSLAVMKTMDAIRAEWPLRYPMEKKAAKKARKAKKTTKKAKTSRR
jgi:predicted dehydrogenase